MVVPILVKIFAVMLAGTAGWTMFFTHPEVAKSALPSVGIVLVEHTASDPTSGTAFVAGDHLLMTAAHVVGGASHIMAKFKDTEWLEARVVALDSINDVAVLSYAGPDIAPLPFADLDKVKPGDYVAVVAYPSIEDLAKQSRGQKDLQEKAAKGITGAEGTVHAVRGPLLVIATANVPLNGGPALNLKGEVLGVVRGKLNVTSPELVTYATPSNIAKPLLTPAEQRRPVEAAPAAPAQPPQAAAAGSSQTTASNPPQAPAQSAGQAAVEPSTQAPSEPATSGPSSPAAQAPAASPTPAQPAMPGSPRTPSASSSPLTPFLIVPGQSIGAVRLGSPLREVELGSTKGTQRLEDGTTMYRWFEPPANTGIGVRTNENGTVLRVWVLNDSRYQTKDGLHVGSTEAEIRAALGIPTRVEFSSQAKTRTLVYESLGLWFSIQLDQQYNFYNTVFDIGVMSKK